MAIVGMGRAECAVIDHHRNKTDTLAMQQRKKNDFIVKNISKIRLQSSRTDQTIH